MTKDQIKSDISDAHGKMTELEAAARKLQNQNLADIVASAKNKLRQLLDHPDLERVGDEPQEVQQEPLPFTSGAPQPPQA